MAFLPDFRSNGFLSQDTRHASVICDELVTIQCSNSTGSSYPRSFQFGPPATFLLSSIKLPMFNHLFLCTGYVFSVRDLVQNFPNIFTDASVFVTILWRRIYRYLCVRFSFGIFSLEVVFRSFSMSVISGYCWILGRNLTFTKTFFYVSS